jgi:hypothetical protein
VGRSGFERARSVGSAQERPIQEDVAAVEQRVAMSVATGLELIRRVLRSVDTIRSLAKARLVSEAAAKHGVAVEQQ